MHIVDMDVSLSKLDELADNWPNNVELMKTYVYFLINENTEMFVFVSDYSLSLYIGLTMLSPKNTASHSRLF